MSSPKFTIIIVVYNGEKNLQRAIESVTSQLFQHFELLLVDGLSADSTMEIIQKNAQKDARIKFISEKDEGIYDAMNKGIKKATGEWLYFLGSDDYLANEKVLEKIDKEINKVPYNLVYGDVILLPEKKRYGGKFSSDDLLVKNISHQAIFYHRAVFQTIGLFDTTYPTHADWDFNLRCFMSKSVVSKYIDLVIAYFEKGGVSGRYDIRFMQEVLIPLFIEKFKLDPAAFKQIFFYDVCWRLLRNADIRSNKNGYRVLQEKEIPEMMLKMIRMQKRIPAFFLKTGIFSKLLMGLSYFQNRLLGFK